MPLQPRRRGHALISVLIAAFALTGCDRNGPVEPEPSDPNNPDPGVLAVSMQTPTALIGALFISISGPATPTVTPASPDHRVFSHVVGPGEVRVIVVADIAPVDTILLLDVPDRRPKDAYEIEILQLAERDSDLRNSHAGYTFTLLPVE